MRIFRLSQLRHFRMTPETSGLGLSKSAQALPMFLLAGRRKKRLTGRTGSTLTGGRSFLANPADLRPPDGKNEVRHVHTVIMLDNRPARRHPVSLRHAL